MSAKELRQKYLNFFQQKGHAVLSSAPLIPQDDPTVLFTTAGMHPLVPYLLGQKHPQGQRLVSVQKCVRTVDIDEVGDENHHTFFEMLGNWSLGDYFKKEAIEWSFEFLTKYLNIAPERLAVSVFKGNRDAPLDQESINIWKSLGIPEERIVHLGKKDNWWGPAGQTGPCGPDTEMFYWADNQSSAPTHFNPKDKHWVEIWNDVFMEYNKTAQGKYEPLKQKNVDTGMGLERTLAVMNGLIDDYQTELFLPIIQELEQLSKQSYQDNPRAFRIIADHLKAATFVLAEGLEPSNLERGYVLRRLIRRAVRYGRQLGIADNFTDQIAKVVTGIYQEEYPEVLGKQEFIFEQLQREEKKFRQTLERGMKQFNRLAKNDISGKDAFDLYQTYGFPIEMTKELAQERGLKVDEGAFQEELKKHQELSRTASAGRFKSGLADHSEQVTKYHTATHLLLAALRRVLGHHIVQRGSNITAQRLRFDFNHSEKMTPQQIQQVEDWVNQKIKEDLPVTCQEMTLEAAKQRGAMGIFEAKYGEKVKVYTIGKRDNIFSQEICTGPHVEHTGQLGHFRITKEESSSAGIRRIRAVLE